MSLSSNLIEIIKKLYDNRQRAIEYEKNVNNTKCDIAVFYDECLGFIEQIFSGRDIDTIEVSSRPVVKDYVFLDWLTEKPNQGYNLSYMERTKKDIEKVDVATPAQQYIISQLINILSIENYKLPDIIFDCENKNYIFLMKVHFHKMLHKFYVMMQRTEHFELIDKYNAIAFKYNRRFNKCDYFGNNAMIIFSMFENNMIKKSISDVKKIIVLLEGIMEDHIDFEYFIPTQKNIPTHVQKLITPKKTYTLDVLRNYKVDGLKQLCEENNIYVKSNSRRADYEKALLSLK